MSKLILYRMEVSAAERHYQAMKEAQKRYYRKKNPNPKPVGRPRKVLPEVLASVPETPTLVQTT